MSPSVQNDHSHDFLDGSNDLRIRQLFRRILLAVLNEHVNCIGA
jgi:hypothetical protein